jgi:uncharacterized membrane protein HdeD (DUF308 family)
MIFAHTNLDMNALAARWWMLAIRGVAAILFGIAAIVWPGISLLALVTLWGAYALVDGVFGVVLAARVGRAGQRWGWLLFDGLVSIGAAAVAFLWPQITALALLALIALWAVVGGVAQIVAAVELRREITGEWLLALGGVLSIAFGVLMLIFPGAGALAIVSVIGIYSIVSGVLVTALGFKIRRLSTPGRHAMPTNVKATPA